MAHFAKIENNTVVDIITVDNKDITANGVESEQAGKDFLARCGIAGNWVQTSYSGSTKNKFAKIGDVYDSVNDLFVQEETVVKHTDSWQGILPPVSPSIMFDAVARSANQWTMEVIKQAFPQAFQRWGYLQQHRPESFAKGLANFDVTATVVRNPIDSLASSVLAFNLLTDEAITNQIAYTETMLAAILANKDKILIFKFEDATANSSLITSAIGAALNLTPQPFDAVPITLSLTQGMGGSTYSLPIDNKTELDEAKLKLAETQFAAGIAELNALYKDILS